jgi:cytochrome c oxidase subunit 2
MLSGLPFLPEQASTVAGRVDALYLFLVGLSLFFGLLIAGLVLVFAVRYRRRSETERPADVKEPLALELTWTLIPLGIVTVIFFWSAQLFISLNRVPRDAMEIYVVGKRWMWKIQHMTGQREINELHVPVGVPVKLSLTSEDVIHSFYVPAFRVKKDVLPGRYTTLWFQATLPGRYHLFCAEYCGTKHSGMIGWVVVQEPAQFQAWLAGGAGAGSLASAGQRLFTELACITCHRGDASGRGPALDGLFGKSVSLANGESVTADEGYLRESVLTPSAKVVAGYQPIMPTYQGLVSEEGLMQLIAYIQGLKPPAGKEAPLAAAPTSARPPAGDKAPRSQKP